MHSAASAAAGSRAADASLRRGQTGTACSGDPGACSAG